MALNLAPMFETQTAQEVLEALESTSQGISAGSIESRREQYGFNELPQKKKSLLKLFFHQFHDIMVWILMAALAISIAMPFFEHDHVSLGSFVDGYVIFAILILNALLGFFQEFKAEQAIAMLQKLTSPETRVRRDRQEMMIPSRDLLPGDVVILEAGDRISADGRLIMSSNLRVNESSLTGESLAVDKKLDPVEEGTNLADRHCMVFSGTVVTKGNAECVVTATGVDTEIGKIAKLVSETKIPETPLQKRMKKLGQLLGLVVLVLCFLVLGIGLLQGKELFHMLLIAVSLAVSAVPEGLPAVITVSFAMGVRRMVSKNALVRRLDSLETLGSVTVICSDKTGTITQNKMHVVDKWIPGESDEEEKLLIQIGASCNTAQLPDLGDPTEIGLLEDAKNQNIERLTTDEIEVPFNSEDKYMQTRHCKTSYIKGAPEKIVELCGFVNEEEIMKQNDAFAVKGLRVLGCGVQEGDSFRFIGLIAMEDPPRPTAKASIAQAKKAGIRTMMITGDNIKTASAIAEQVGIEGDAMCGVDLDAVTDDELQQIVKTTSVYARVSPDHKLRILKALQNQDEIVAMSGDGVNDAPALKGAHVGVAMGKVGTEVAREASSIVLADDQYSTIVAAIAEGRRIYDNIKKFVILLLRANFDELLFIMTTLFLGLPLPYLPIHILWINLMTDGLPALALGMEPAEPDIMERAPRPHHEHLLHGEWIRLIIAALIGYAVTLIYYTNALRDGVPLELARTGTLIVAIIFELLMAYSVRSWKPLLKIGIFTNKWMVGATIIPLIITLVFLMTPLGALLHLQAVTLAMWGPILLYASVGVIVLEILKLLPDKWGI